MVSGISSSAYKCTRVMRGALSTLDCGGAAGAEKLMYMHPIDAQELESAQRLDVGEARAAVARTDPKLNEPRQVGNAL